MMYKLCDNHACQRHCESEDAKYCPYCQRIADKAAADYNGPLVWGVRAYTHDGEPCTKAEFDQHWFDEMGETPAESEAKRQMEAALEAAKHQEPHYLMMPESTYREFLRLLGVSDDAIDEAVETVKARDIERGWTRELSADPADLPDEPNV